VMLGRALAPPLKRCQMPSHHNNKTNVNPQPIATGNDQDGPPN
jgi:hypothetical protein